MKRLSQLLEGVNVISNTVEGDPEISAVVFDSRQVKKGCLFAAIKGLADDGHRYIGDALASGAACCIVGRPHGKNCIETDDTRAALATISANFYDNPAKSLKLIGITGTNGKTTTAYLIKQVLDSVGYKTGLIGTVCNMIGDSVVEARYTTPEPTQLHALFAQMRDAGVEYVVMEASSQSLEQRRVKGLVFEAAVFTNLTQDHLDYHGTMEAYLNAKAILFTQAKQGIFNADDPASDKIIAMTGCKATTYSAESDRADVIAKNMEFHRDGVSFQVLAQGRIGSASLGIPGKFSVYNALAVISTCVRLGISPEDILRGLAASKGVKGRAEVVKTGRDFTVMIDYAHTPDGLFNLLSSIRGVAPGRVVTLFGCGGDRDRTKRPLMGKIAFDLSDYCIVTSDNPRTENPSSIIANIMEGVKTSKTPCKVIENRREAIEFAIKNAVKDDIIILAGKGHETYQILRDRTIRFDEREIVAEVLKALPENNLKKD